MYLQIVCNDPTVDPYKSCTSLLEADTCMNRDLSCTLTHIVNAVFMSSKVQRFKVQSV